jgi:hypothetical protein
MHITAITSQDAESTLATSTMKTRRNLDMAAQNELIEIKPILHAQMFAACACWGAASQQCPLGQNRFLKLYGPTVVSVCVEKHS